MGERENAERCYKAILDSMMDAQIAADTSGRIVEANKAALTTFGYKEDDLIGRNVHELMPEPWRGKHDSYIERAVATGDGRVLGGERRRNLRAMRKSGETFPIELAVARFEIDGEVYFNGWIRDLSAFQPAILHSRRLLAAVENAADAILVLDDDLRVLYANSSALDRYGYAESEIVGHTLTQIGWGRSDARIYEDMRAVIGDGKKWTGRVQTARRDGLVIAEDVTIAPVSDDDGRSFFVHIRRDVTNKIEMERQLLQAQKLESIGQLAAGIAHEINTPTQYVGDNTLFLKDACEDICRLFQRLEELAVDGGADLSGSRLRELLKEADAEYLSEELPRAIGQSLEGIERISTIVRAMKAFSHQGTDKQTADVNAALRSSVTLASNEWKYHANVEFDLEPDLPPISCVIGQLNQVFVNMIVNAAHAIEDANESLGREKGLISVRTRTAKESIVIEFADDGAGMSAEVAARVFDPFFTTKEVGKGTGQGLSLAYRVVVDGHGGMLEVDSEEGEGTTFRIRLPIEGMAQVEESAAA